MRPYPVGVHRECSHCHEYVELKDQANIDSFWVHTACLIRGVIGSIAHLQQRCGCYVPGSDESDDPSLTRRQAAEASYIEWRRQTTSQKK